MQREVMGDCELIERLLPVAMDQLSGMIDSAIFLELPSITSGPVEIQRILTRLRGQGR